MREAARAEPARSRTPQRARPRTLAAELGVLQRGRSRPPRAAGRRGGARPRSRRSSPRSPPSATAKRAALARDRAREDALLMALVRLATMPPRRWLLAPRPPLDALRGALVMAQTVPPLEAQHRGLAAGASPRLAGRRAPQIASAEARQRDERRSQLADAQAAARTQLVAAAIGAPRQGRRSAARGTSGQAISPARQRPRPAAQRDRIGPASQAEEAGRRDALPARAGRHPRPSPTAPRRPRSLPVAGHARSWPFRRARRVRRDPAQGLTFETRPGAQVVAPFDGQVCSPARSAATGKS